MPDVAVVVPWRGGCEYRERAWAWLRPRYQWPVIEAPAPPGPWVKALAAMPAVTAAPPGAIVVVADADVWTDGLRDAIQAVQDGAGWAIPHWTVHRLAETATDAMLAGGDWRGQPLARRAYQGLAGGGVVVALRETLLQVPLDPRFIGWGQEDQSHAIALTTLAGAPWRGTADLTHLWHPPQPRLSRSRGSEESWRLRRRYLQARHDPAAMRRLLTEATDALHAHQPAVHDLEPQRVD